MTGAAALRTREEKIMTPFESPRDPNYPDWDAGREDASRTNPRRSPGTRTGRALEAYLAGQEFGLECLSSYLEEMDEQS
jgi:hypothetical protein